MIGLQIIFEDAGTGNGEKCIECKEIIEGIKFQMMLQVGKAEQGNLIAFDAYVCEKCKSSLIQWDEKTVYCNGKCCSRFK